MTLNVDPKKLEQVPSEFFVSQITSFRGSGAAARPLGQRLVDPKQANDKKIETKKPFYNQPLFTCSDCIHWKPPCGIGYRTYASSGCCRQFIRRKPQRLVGKRTNSSLSQLSNGDGKR